MTRVLRPNAALRQTALDRRGARFRVRGVEVVRRRGTVHPVEGRGSGGDAEQHRPRVVLAEVAEGIHCVLDLGQARRVEVVADRGVPGAVEGSGAEAARASCTSLRRDTMRLRGHQAENRRQDYLEVGSGLRGGMSGRLEHNGRCNKGGEEGLHGE